MFRQLTTQAYFSIFINDAYAYSSWALQFSDALREGIIYPRWMPLDFWGYGSPDFVYYPPLSFYIVALFNVFTGSITLAMNITRFISLFLSGVGIFFFVKEMYTEKAATVAALFYILLPYNISQFYLLGSFASTISLMWFSPILLNVYKYSKTGEFKYSVYAGICYGGLILTHVINAYMFTFVALTFIIFISIADKKPKHLYMVILIALIGVSLAAAYVFPLIHEKNLISINCFSKGGGLYFSNYFILPTTIDKSTLNFIWPLYYNSFATLVLVMFYCFTGLFFIISVYKSPQLEKRKVKHNFHYFFFSNVVTSIFLLFAPSTFLWVNIPFFKFIHFPVRWLNITAFVITLLCSSFFYRLNTVSTLKRALNLGIFALFSIFLILDCYYISNACTFNEQELVPVRPENAGRDHLPAGVEIKKLDWGGATKRRVTVTTGEGKAEAVIWKSAERIINVEASRPITARIRTFNFPGWTAYLDDNPTGINTEIGTGAMLVNIPAGNHRLKLVFKDTPIRFYGRVVSFFTFILLSAILVCGRFRRTDTLSEKAVGLCN